MPTGVAVHRGPVEARELSLSDYATLAAIAMNWKLFGEEPSQSDAAALTGVTKNTFASRVLSLRKRGFLRVLRVTEAGLEELRDASGWETEGFDHV